MYPSNKASAKADEMILESRDLPPHLLGAPCALCESLAHLLAQAREENERLRRTHTLSIGSDDAMTIRRLAADNAALREDAEKAETELGLWRDGSIVREEDREEVAKLKADNAALRAALSRIDTVWMNQEEAYADYCEAAWRMVEIARAAINAARKE